MKISKRKKNKRFLSYMAGKTCSHCNEKFKYGEVGHFVPALGIWICERPNKNETGNKV